MNLPEGCELTYIIAREANYPTQLDAQDIEISAAYREGKTAWEFSVQEYGRPICGLELRMFHDSWDAFEQIPEFFTALRTACPSSLTELRKVLDDIGARDATQRTRPTKQNTGSTP